MAVLLALGTALCYGVSNFLGPQISRALPTMAVLVGGQLVALSVSAVVVIATAEEVPPGTHIAAGLLAGTGNALGLALFYLAAKTGPLSIITPIGALGAGLPVLIGVASGEAIGLVGAVGVLVAIGGVALASRRRGGDTAEEAANLRRTVLLSLASAVAFGIFLWAIAPASEEGIFWGVLMSRISLVVLLVGGALVTSRALRVPAADIPRVALPGVLLFCGTMLYAAATREGLLSVVSVIGSLFPVVTIALAYVFLHERLSRLQWVGVTSSVLGVVLLSAAS